MRGPYLTSPPCNGLTSTRWASRASLRGAAAVWMQVIVTTVSVSSTHYRCCNARNIVALSHLRHQHPSSTSCSKHQHRLTLTPKTLTSPHSHARNTNISSLSRPKHQHRLTFTPETLSPPHFHARPHLPSTSCSKHQHRLTLTPETPSSPHFHARNTNIASLSRPKHQHLVTLTPKTPTSPHSHA